MASAIVEPVPSDDTRGGGAWLVFGIAAPLLILSVAYSLWWISDQLLYIGPLDRAAFSWAFVVPVWLSAPVVAGFIWKSFGARRARIAALGLGAVVSAVASYAFWQSIGTPFDCGFGTVTPAIDFLPQTLIVGILVGGGLALDGLAVRELARHGVRWWAVVIGSGTELFLVFVAFFAVFAAFEGHTCFVPGPNYPVGP
jgi:hypothetical protein